MCYNRIKVKVLVKMDTMKTLDIYLERYGKYTFLEEEFNEVDAMILSLLSYVDLLKIVSNTKKEKITIKEAFRLFHSQYTKKEINQNILSVRNASRLLEKVATTLRFQDLYLYHYRYEVTLDMQFGAMCVLLPTNEIYVSYEGTDSYVSGWKEDFMFSYLFPTNAQREAIDYLNRVTGLLGRKIYVGGHSKGGNLALVASMFCKPSVRHKIKKVFNFDGPGLRKEQFESKQYQKIFSRLVSYVPKFCFVGMLLNHADNYIVVDSKNIKFFQHDATSWIIEDKKFKRANLSEFSKKVEIGLMTWLETIEDSRREKFVGSLFSIFKKAEINDLNDIRKSKINSMIKIIRETRNLDKESKEMMIAGFKRFCKEVKE